MDGLQNNGNPYFLMDDLGGFPHPYFWVNTHRKEPPAIFSTVEQPYAAATALSQRAGEIAGVEKTRRVAKLWRFGVKTKPDSKGGRKHYYGSISINLIIVTIYEYLFLKIYIHIYVHTIYIAYITI